MQPWPECTLNLSKSCDCSQRSHLSLIQHAPFKIRKHWHSEDRRRCSKADQGVLLRENATAFGHLWMERQINRQTDTSIGGSSFWMQRFKWWIWKQSYRHTHTSRDEVAASTRKPVIWERRRPEGEGEFCFLFRLFFLSFNSEDYPSSTPDFRANLPHQSFGLSPLTFVFPSKQEHSTDGCSEDQDREEQCQHHHPGAGAGEQALCKTGHLSQGPWTMCPSGDTVRKGPISQSRPLSW